MPALWLLPLGTAVVASTLLLLAVRRTTGDLEPTIRALRRVRSSLIPTLASLRRELSSATERSRQGSVSDRR